MHTNPAIHFKSLSVLLPEELLACFNESFREYFVPFQLTNEQMFQKIKAEGIRFDFSVGAFIENRLVGFILHGIDEYDGRLTAYNAGTGILPAYRGAGLLHRLYRFALDFLRENHIRYSLLEVICENIAALQGYKRAGFTIKRQLDSFVQENVGLQSEQGEIWEMPLTQFNEYRLSCSWEPSWQYNRNTLLRAGDYRLFLTGRQHEPAAYCIVNPGTGRIAHFGCTNFSQNEADLLSIFAYVSALSRKKLSVAHIDHRAAEAITFLTRIGFDLLVKSYEMELFVSDPNLAPISKIPPHSVY